MINSNSSGPEQPVRLFKRRISSRLAIERMLGIRSETISTQPEVPAAPAIEEPVIEQASMSTPIEEPIVAEQTTPEESQNGTPISSIPVLASFERKLAINDITTVEQLQDYIANHTDLVDLKEIGAKASAKILEGFNVWQSEQKKTESTEQPA